MVSLFPLTADGLIIERNEKRILGPFDLTLKQGGLTVVLGPNGAGKSTLLRALHGLEKPTRGRIRYACPRPEAFKQQAFVFQSPVLLRRTVLGNLAYPLRIHGVSKQDAERKAKNWLERLGLAERAQLRASSLSGGERQKLALARALIRKPELLFLDEPCASLDGHATQEIEALLQEAKTQGTRILMTTHDLGQAKRLADDVLFLHEGSCLEAAPAARIFTEPQTKQAAAFLKGDLVL